MTTRQQVSTLRSTGLMPSCQQRFFGRRLTQLSTVHGREDARSFYRDINGFPQRVNIGWPRVGEQAKRAGLNHRSADLVTDETGVSQAAGMAAGSQQAAGIVERAKRVTGLSMKDLAPVFGVTRQTLYNFRKAQERISDRHWVRLQAVDREIRALATILPSSPGALAKHFVSQGDTLHRLLRAPDLDTPRLQRLAEALAAQLGPVQQPQVYHASTVDQLTRHG